MAFNITKLQIPKIKRSVSIFSLNDLDTFFYKTNNIIDTTNASTITYTNEPFLYATTCACNHKFLSKLVSTATNSNYWLSQKALHILAKGIDIEELTLFTDLLSHHEWYLLMMGPHSKDFVYTQMDHTYGWLNQLLSMTPTCENIIDYIETYSSDRDAMMAIIHLHLDAILANIYDVDICIWEFLLQIPNGVNIMIRYIGNYDCADQKKLIKMASNY